MQDAEDRAFLREAEGHEAITRIQRESFSAINSDEGGEGMEVMNEVWRLLLEFAGLGLVSAGVGEHFVAMEADAGCDSRERGGHFHYSLRVEILVGAEQGAQQHLV